MLNNMAYKLNMPKGIFFRVLIPLKKKRVNYYCICIVATIKTMQNIQ